MNILILIAGLIFAVIGQFLKSIKGFPTEAVQLAMVFMGLVLYVIQAGLPAQWVPLDPKWSEGAALWVTALPGMATLMGMVPALKTDSR